MPILPTTPSISTFTTAWTTEAEKAFKAAAGKDGRLTVTEAKRLAENRDGSQFFSDNAVAWLNANKQQSVSVSKLVAAASAYAEAKAKVAAGADGKVSLADGAKLPADLRDDFLYLRGKTAVTPAPDRETWRKLLTAAALKAIDDGTAKKLSTVPATLRGLHPVVLDIPHPASNTRFSIFVAEGRMYLQRASDVPSPLVGFWDAGPAPA